MKILVDYFFLLAMSSVTRIHKHTQKDRYTYIYIYIYIYIYTYIYKYIDIYIYIDRERMRKRDKYIEINLFSNSGICSNSWMTRITQIASNQIWFYKLIRHRLHNHYGPLSKIPLHRYRWRQGQKKNGEPVLTKRENWQNSCSKINLQLCNWSPCNRSIL